MVEVTHSFKIMDLVIGKIPMLKNGWNSNKTRFEVYSNHTGCEILTFGMRNIA